MIRRARGKLHRDALRYELSAFTLMHVGNRALVASLLRMGEVDVHLGVFELDESAAALLAIKNHATHGNGDCADTAAGHRGDGEGVALDAAGQSGTIGASANEATSKFNEEHFNAII